jgi:hypothetical protein
MIIFSMNGTFLVSYISVHLLRILGLARIDSFSLASEIKRASNCETYEPLFNLKKTLINYGKF